MSFIEKTTNSTTIFEGRVFTIKKDDVVCPNGHISTREVVEHLGGVAIVAIDNDGKILMAKQHRYAVKKELLEIPAGKLEKNEDIRECGIRELREETGATAKNFEFLGKMLPTPGYDNEVIYIYEASDLTFGDTCFDIGEFIELYRFSFSELMQKISSGEIEDAKTVYGLTMYALKHNLIKL